jgi:hypothetical protein
VGPIKVWSKKNTDRSMILIDRSIETEIQNVILIDRSIEVFLFDRSIDRPTKSIKVFLLDRVIDRWLNRSKYLVMSSLLQPIEVKRKIKKIHYSHFVKNHMYSDTDFLVKFEYFWEFIHIKIRTCLDEIFKEKRKSLLEMKCLCFIASACVRNISVFVTCVFSLFRSFNVRSKYFSLCHMCIVFVS